MARFVLPMTGNARKYSWRSNMELGMRWTQPLTAYPPCRGTGSTMKRLVSMRFGGYETSIHQCLVPLPIIQMPRQKVMDGSSEGDSEKEHFLAGGLRHPPFMRNPHRERTIRHQGDPLRGRPIVAWGKCSGKGRVRSEPGGRDAFHPRLDWLHS